MTDDAYRYHWCLPYPVGVSTNHLYVGNGRNRHLTPAAFSWRQTVIVQIRQYAIDHHWPLALPGGALALYLDAYPPAMKRTRDDDGIVKFTRDTVMAAFFAVDTCIRHTESTMWPPSPGNPRLLVRLEPWPKEGSNEQGH